MSAKSEEDAVPVIAPQTTFPAAVTLSAEAPEQMPPAIKRFEVLAVVAKKFVLVALVVVASVAVSSWSWVRFAYPVPVAVSVVKVPPMAKSEFAKRLVVVALVPVALVKVS